MAHTDLTIREIADEARVTPMTVGRWIWKGYKGIKLHATPMGHKYLINPNTWAAFKYKTGLLRGPA